MTTFAREEFGETIFAPSNPELVTEVVLNVCQNIWAQLFGVYHVDSPKVE